MGEAPQGARFVVVKDGIVAVETVIIDSAATQTRHGLTILSAKDTGSKAFFLGAD